MSAEIIYLRPRYAKACPYSAFRKALLAITILGSFTAEEAAEVIAFWVLRGLINDDEARALYTFYGWE